MSATRPLQHPAEYGLTHWKFCCSFVVLLQPLHNPVQSSGCVFEDNVCSAALEDKSGENRVGYIPSKTVLGRSRCSIIQCSVVFNTLKQVA